MTDAVVICRWIVAAATAVAVYPYLFYPAALWMLQAVRRKPWTTGDFVPTVDLIVAAHNEEKIIDQKIRNCLELDYPPEKLNICIVSDGSTDRTDAIAESHSPRVHFLRLEPRGGKQAALNYAVEQTHGEILLFTDASVRIRKDLVQRVVRSFADSTVGAVSTTIHIVSRRGDEGFPQSSSSGEVAREAESTYLDLDLKIRKLESMLGSAVGCCGSCYAVRRSCFVPFDPGACNDFASALDAVTHGKRAVFDSEAVGYMLAARRDGGEYERKARTIAGGIDTLWRSGVWKGLWRRPLFLWQLLSHKLLRWLGPPAVVVAWSAAIFGAALGDRLLAFLAITGFVLVGTGLLGSIAWRDKRPPFPVRLCKFGVISTVAGIAGWWRFLRGQRQIVWRPTQR